MEAAGKDQTEEDIGFLICEGLGNSEDPCESQPQELDSMQSYYQNLTSMVNEQVIPWVGLQVVGPTTSTTVEGHATFHPGTRSYEDVVGTANRNRNSGDRALSCKRICVLSWSETQCKGVDSKIEAVSEGRIEMPQPQKGRKVYKTSGLTCRADSTTQYLKMGDEQAEERCEWVVTEADELKQILSDSQFDQLKEVLRSTRVGFLHVNTLRGRFRWGQLKTQSERLVFKTNIVQRNRSGNLRKSMDIAAPHLGYRPLLERCLPVFDWTNVYLTWDRHAGNERLEKEIVVENEDFDTCGTSVSYCAGHDVGHVAEGPLAGHGIKSNIFQINGVARHAEVQERWANGWAKAINRDTSFISPCGKEAIAQAKNESLTMVQRICKLSYRRQSNIKARRHPSWVAPEEDSEDFHKVKATEELEEATFSEHENKLACTFHLQSRNFARRRHLCDYTRNAGEDRDDPTECRCKDQGDALLNMCRAFVPPAVEMLPRTKVAESRWGVYQTMLRVIFYLVMVGYTGIDGWLAEFDSDESGQVQLNNMTEEQIIAALTNFGEELKRRQGGVTKTVKDLTKVIFMTLDNVGLYPLDSLLQFIQAVDSEANVSSRQLPLVVLWFAESSPVKVALREIVQQMKGKGDLRWLLGLWHRNQQLSAAFWKVWVKRFMAMNIHQACAMEFYFVPRSRDYPGKYFKVAAYKLLYGVEDDRTREAAREVYEDPRCCKDPGLGWKIDKASKSVDDVLYGPAAQCMDASVEARELFQINVDQEDDQSRHQHQNSVRGVIGIEALCEGSAMDTWLIEHRRRGGIVETKLRKEDIKESNVNTRQRHKQDRKRKGKYQSRTSGWFLYRSAKSQEHKALLMQYLQVHPVRAAPRKKQIRSMDYMLKLVKNQNTGIMPWKEKEKELRNEWESDTLLQAQWNQKAMQKSRVRPRMSVKT